MANTRQPAGWTSQFRELLLDVDGGLHDLRGADDKYASALDPDDYEAAQAVGERLYAAGGEGVVYPSVRNPTGECAGLFYLDLAASVTQGRHCDYHWNGTHVDLFREPAKSQVYRLL